MACAAKCGDSGTGSPRSSARDDPAGQAFLNHPVISACRKALQVRCAVWSPGPG